MAGVFRHKGILRIGPSDFGSREALRQFPFEGSGNSDHSRFFPVGVEAGVVMNVEPDGEGSTGRNATGL